MNKILKRCVFILICLTVLLPALITAEEIPREESLLRLDIIVSGSGIVSGPGMECTGVCSYFFEKGSKVSLHAEPASEWHFVGWDGCGTEQDCEVVLERHTTVMAIFVHP